MCKPLRLFTAAASVPVFSTPRRLNESMCVLVIGRGAGETWFVSLSLIEMQQYTAYLSLSLPLLYFYLSPPLLPRSHLISALPSKRQGADRPFFIVQARNPQGSQFNVPCFIVGHR